jgi:hypothetical protein
MNLTGDDGDAVTMDPGEEISLEFGNPPVTPGMERSFALISHGQYTKLMIK